MDWKSVLLIGAECLQSQNKVQYMIITNTIRAELTLMK